MKSRFVKLTAALALLLGACTVATPQLDSILKGAGIFVVVDQFGGEMNKGINNLVGHKNSEDSYTKVVPIVTVGFNSSEAVGAAQVRGTQDQVERVRAVAQVEGEVIGIRLRALVPVATRSPSNADSLNLVDGVGVSGIIDLEL
jgi:hypothetical protein